MYPSLLQRIMKTFAPAKSKKTNPIKANFQIGRQTTDDGRKKTEACPERKKLALNPVEGSKGQKPEFGPQFSVLRPLFAGRAY
jgi:hypothetical protein